MRSRYHRWGALLLATLLVLGGGYLVRLQGVHQAYRQGVLQALELERSRQSMLDQVVTLEPARQALVNAEGQLRAARWRLSAGGGMSELLDQLASSGRAHGLLFERFEVGDQVPENGYRRLPLQMQVTGRYAALRLWLDEWLGQLRVLQVSSLQLAEVGEATGLLRLHLQVQVFDAGEVLPAPASLAHEQARAAPQPPRLDPFAPWTSRRAPAGLAGVPLEQLEMVGSLSRQGRHHALLRVAGRLYRVGEGDRLGREDGVVANIDEERVEIRQRLFVAGRWQAHATYLVLSKRVDKEVRDEQGAMLDGAAGDRPGDPGIGESVSG
ncbi:pilus assembly protein PilP [Pseudomonas entomophila]|uniref:pilus assembly protein PilP n=1 Tax=Pseudomonas entomophila TaxID=312306 RepID=UPI0023D7F449|nr:pilus assembly protein PilP [Pseudomonas entomophila]MDF0734052.1 pilus assembly protein PilP [Pseudomonas entomophila]